MASIEKKSLDKPDTSQPADKTTREIVALGNATIDRATLQPGWRWSQCIKPLVGTDSCEVPHLGYVISGHIHIIHDDGTEADLGPGDAYRIEPGHDAWVVGDEPFVRLEFESQDAATYG